MQWIDSGRGQPPMRFADLAAGTVTDEALLDEINALLAIKMQSGEAEYSPRWPQIHAFIEVALAKADRCPDYKRPEGEAPLLDAFLMQAILEYEKSGM